MMGSIVSAAPVVLVTGSSRPVAGSSVSAGSGAVALSTSSTPVAVESVSLSAPLAASVVSVAFAGCVTAD